MSEALLWPPGYETEHIGSCLLVRDRNSFKKTKQNFAIFLINKSSVSFHI